MIINRTESSEAGIDGSDVPEIAGNSVSGIGPATHDQFAIQGSLESGGYGVEMFPGVSGAGEDICKNLAYLALASI